MKIGTTLQISIGALGLALFAVAAQAQTSFQASAATNTTVSGAASSAGKSAVSDLLPESAVSSFVATYHVPVIQSATPLAARPIDSAPPTARLRQLQQLAVNSNATWRKIYRVTPAETGMPVTTYDAARKMVDQNAIVDLNVSGIPASNAIRTVASADSATVEFTNAPPTKPIDVAMINTTIPQAMATIAQRTDTHWQAVYELAPIANQTATPNRVAIASRQPLNQEQWEETHLFNGPISVQFPIPPKVTTPPVTTTSAKSKTTSNGTPNANPTAPGALSPDQNPYGMNPYGAGYQYGPNPYGPYGGYPQRAPQPYNLSPGLVVSPLGGSDSTIVFGGANQPNQ